MIQPIIPDMMSEDLKPWEIGYPLEKMSQESREIYDAFLEAIGQAVELTPREKKTLRYIAATEEMSTIYSFLSIFRKINEAKHS